MLSLIFLSIVFSSVFSFISSVNDAEFDEGLFYPNGDETLNLVETQENRDDDFFIDDYRRSYEYDLLLFTRNNPTKPYYLMINFDDSVTNSTFEKSKNTAVLVHGWAQDGHVEMNKILTKAFLENGDVNVIVMDWSKLAKMEYSIAKNGVPKMGQLLGQFLQWFSKFGASLDKMHLVGHSLGGHLVGNAGREVGGKVKRITALDPAGPLWTKDKRRLVKTDAQYVEVIHTNAGGFGINENCGHADFYPNGGHSMPGCMAHACSHARSHEYMAASLIHDKFLANQCDTVNDAVKDTCKGGAYKMGNNDLSKSRSGIFRVNTGKKYPFLNDIQT